MYRYDTQFKGAEGMIEDTISTLEQLREHIEDFEWGAIEEAESEEEKYTIAIDKTINILEALK